MPSSPFAPLDRALAPAAGNARTAFLKTQPFAHRGLHGPGRVENSRAAFNAAIAAGHGIELDVQASRDGEAFVFHDSMLDRLTDESGPIAERTAAMLDGVRLRGSDETIPSLHAALVQILGRVPVLIEVKAPGRSVSALCLAVHRALDGYRGPVAVMSFNPEIGHWFAEHAPHTLRGLVVSEEGKQGKRGAAERRLSLWRSKAEFLAYDIRDLPSRFAAEQRARGLPVLTWTVRDAAAEQVALIHADEIIYERTA